MTQITVDAELRSKLLNLSQPFYLCDESGHIVGKFMPFDTRLPPGCVEPQLGEEEWKRRQEGADYNIDEVISRLEQL